MDQHEREQREAVARLRSEGERVGLCAACRHLRAAVSPRSVFVRCHLARRDPRFPRYPPLPVRRCAGFAPARASVERRDDSGGD